MQSLSPGRPAAIRPTLRVIVGDHAPARRIAFSLVHPRRELHVPASAVLGIEVVPIHTLFCADGSSFVEPRSYVEIEVVPGICDQIYHFTAKMIGEVMEVWVLDRCVWRTTILEAICARYGPTVYNPFIDALRLSAYDNLPAVQRLAEDLRAGWRGSPVRLVR